jgi:hypothetical protein
LLGNTAPRGKTREGLTASIENCLDGASRIKRQHERKLKSQSKSSFSSGFCDNASSNSRSIGYQKECSPTIRTGRPPSVLCINDQGGQNMDFTENKTGTLRAQEHGHQPLIYDNHARDARYSGPLKVVPTITAHYGTGGNNTALVDDHYQKPLVPLGTQITKE